MPYKDPEKAREYARKRWRENKEQLKAAHREWTRKNPERVRQYRKIWDENHRSSFPKYYRKYNLKRCYGVTPEQYEEMLAKQHGLCWCCGKPPKKKRLGIDHDHSTGRVRGLLCHACNTAIGLLGDSLEGLAMGLRYLERAAVTTIFSSEVSR